MTAAVFVGIGGFFGAISRVWVSKQINKWHRSSFPFGTITVNLLGAFLLGMLIASHPMISWKLLLGTGFMGAFTTFSTFKVENIQLYRKGSYHHVLTYLLLSYGGGIILAFLGMMIGHTEF